ncbi:protein of unknown function (DUF4219) [Popillia japonica]|uniref:DUF4219 domain-containing protein n=1 Tax=Popillia japonica TaxID=7064 RepID=A0AAW1JEC6_POPJA
MEDEKYKIPVFDGNNYSNWKFRVQTLLEAQDLSSYIEKEVDLTDEEIKKKDRKSVCENLLIKFVNYLVNESFNKILTKKTTKGYLLLEVEGGRQKAGDLREAIKEKLEGDVRVAANNVTLHILGSDKREAGRRRKSCGKQCDAAYPRHRRHHNERRCGDGY